MWGRHGEDRTSVGRQEENKAGPVRVEVKAKAGLGWPNMCPGGFGTKQHSSKEVNASKVRPKGKKAPVPAPSPLGKVDESGFWRGAVKCSCHCGDCTQMWPLGTTEACISGPGLFQVLAALEVITKMSFLFFLF